MAHRRRRPEHFTVVTALALSVVCLLVILLAFDGTGVTLAQGVAAHTAGPGGYVWAALDGREGSTVVPAEPDGAGNTAAPSQASLRVTKVGPEHAKVGDDVIYAVSITNESPEEIPYITLLTIADSLKGDLTQPENVVSSSCAETLDVGERCQVVYTYTVHYRDPAPLVNTVLVEGQPAESSEVIRRFASHSMEVTRFIYLPTMVRGYPPPWVHGTGLPAGVEVRTLTVCPSDPQVLYVGFGTHGRGVYKSTDAGATWSQTDMEAGDVFGIAVAPGACDTVYAGAWDIGVMKSTSGGASWSPASVGLGGAFVYSVAIDPLDSDVIVAGTADRGVYRSVNAGTSWSQFGLSGIAVPHLRFAAEGEALYAATWGNGVYKWPQDGTIVGPWQAVNSGIASAHRYIYAVGGDPQDGMTAFAATQSGGVYRTLDGGGSWTQVLGDPETVYDVIVDPGDGQIVYAATPAGVYRSMTGGSAGSWHGWSGGLGDRRTRALGIGPDSAEYVHAGTEHGAWRRPR